MNVLMKRKRVYTFAAGNGRGKGVCLFIFCGMELISYFCTFNSLDQNVAKYH